MDQVNLSAIAQRMLQIFSRTAVHQEIAQALEAGNPDRAADIAKDFPETRDWLAYQLGTKTAKPYKSRAQVDKMRAFSESGQITKAAFDAAMAVTPPYEELPERLHEKKGEPTT